MAKDQRQVIAKHAALEGPFVVSLALDVQHAVFASARNEVRFAPAAGGGCRHCLRVD